MPTSIQYLEDIKGETPFIQWFIGPLTSEEQDFVDLVFEEVLSTRGIELLGGNWLKDLGMSSINFDFAYLEMLAKLEYYLEYFSHLSLTMRF